MKICLIIYFSFDLQNRPGPEDDELLNTLAELHGLQQLQLWSFSTGPGLCMTARGIQRLAFSLTSLLPGPGCSHGALGPWGGIMMKLRAFRAIWSQYWIRIGSDWLYVAIIWLICAGIWIGLRYWLIILVRFEMTWIDYVASSLADFIESDALKIAINYPFSCDNFSKQWIWHL